jgi:hypothetical protein
MGIVLKNVNITGGKLSSTVDAPTTGGGATLMRTGQTTSYITGDDGDLQEGRDVDFFTLDYTNPFGNTNRFTDELGGQDYTNDWIIDWTTYSDLKGKVLGYYRINNGVNINWTNAIIQARTSIFGGYNGCRLPNKTEANNILRNQAGALRLNYNPFNLAVNASFWTSTSESNANAYEFRTSNGWIIGVGKTSTSGRRYIPVRTFTVTGTILT